MDQEFRKMNARFRRRQTEIVFEVKQHENDFHLCQKFPATLRKEVMDYTKYLECQNMSCFQLGNQSDQIVIIAYQLPF